MASLATATGGQSIIIYPNSWRAWFKNLANLLDPNTSLGFGTLCPTVITDNGYPPSYCTSCTPSNEWILTPSLNSEIIFVNPERFEICSVLWTDAFLKSQSINNTFYI